MLNGIKQSYWSLSLQECEEATKEHYDELVILSQTTPEHNHQHTFFWMTVGGKNGVPFMLFEHLLLENGTVIPPKQ